MFGLADPVELFKLLNSVSPLAVVALLSYIIYMLVNNKRQVSAVKDNHLHDLPEMLELLRSMNASLERQEWTLKNVSDHIVYIRARVNGRG